MYSFTSVPGSTRISMSVDIFLLQLADVIKLILLFYQSFAALQNKPGSFIDIITYGLSLVTVM